MKYCLECGRIYAESYDEYENKTCCHCGFQLIEDNDTTEQQFLQFSESEKNAYELKIYNTCKQSDFFDEYEYNKIREDLSDWYFTFRFDKYEELTGKKAFTKENELYHNMQSRKRVNEAMAKYAGTTGNSNVPKCPKCGSTSISTGARGVNHFWGFIGASKTVNRCANCGHTWKP